MVTACLRDVTTFGAGEHSDTECARMCPSLGRSATWAESADARQTLCDGVDPIFHWAGNRLSADKYIFQIVLLGSGAGRFSLQHILSLGHASAVHIRSLKLIEL